MGSGPSIPDVSVPRDRVVVVTGGNTGLGYEAAKHIAMMGATVIIACRSEQRAMEAIERMNKEFREAKERGEKNIIQDDKLNVEFMLLDLASLKSTMNFIAMFKSSGRKLHVLLCNAGVGLVVRGYTEDGYEMHFQVNYLGHFLLVAHLLPIMKQSGDDCRIVFVSSSAHEYGNFNLEKAQAKIETDYSRMKYYGNSKMYQIQHMSCLVRRLQDSNVSVTCLHPGIVATEINRNYSDMRCFHGMIRCMNNTGCFKSSYQGAITLIDAAVNPKWKGVNDVYFVKTKPAATASAARNKQYQEDLWKYSLHCLQDYLSDDVISALEGLK
ncbi:WW domain-containing oxidoreductase-like [Gigantopelta aegis]|uniref:WW domain-containing oxidoreductase-like n=1 Tax=Gigantopelta aegis TaxID=1735272 RepID=UPI001B88E533|nr:WW domain-containing oxidoreductase-like [Gigantopelta aegis]